MAALGLSCGMWDQVPWPGTEPWPPALGARVLATGLPAKYLIKVLPNQWYFWWLRKKNICCLFLIFEYNVITGNWIVIHYPCYGIKVRNKEVYVGEVIFCGRLNYHSISFLPCLFLPCILCPIELGHGHATIAVCEQKL